MKQNGKCASWTMKGLAGGCLFKCKFYLVFIKHKAKMSILSHQPFHFYSTVRQVVKADHVQYVATV